MLKFLLDTHIVIYGIKRRPVEVLGLFNENAGQLSAHGHPSARCTSAINTRLC